MSSHPGTHFDPVPSVPSLVQQEGFCFSLDHSALSRALDAELGAPGLDQLTRERCPYVFSAQPVFITERYLQQMKAVVDAVESVVRSDAWRDSILASAPDIVRHNPGPTQSVFMGYDFHIGDGTVGLIEINTNAGGAMLNLALAKAQRACCPEVSMLLPAQHSDKTLEQDIVQMFRKEWALSGSLRPLATVAIVDEAPEQQYLYPEFVLFRELFARHGIQAVITGPDKLIRRDGALWAGDVRIDLVYNRLTDFLLEEPASQTLQQAWLNDEIVLTPNPQAHALYADKRNLARLTDPAELLKLGVPEHTRQTLLSGIPRTVIVDPTQAETLWQQRRKLFFKPASGYGGKAAYRGDKITKRVWQEILTGDYVAQALMPPGERSCANGSALIFKFDLRNYVYDGQILWTAARLYQGQTTNFRTPGGGFAPVYAISP